MQADNIVALNQSSPQTPTTAGIQILNGTVESVARASDSDKNNSDGRFRILCSLGIISATRAFSCLIEPQTGDSVLFSHDPEHGSHIISITHRPDSQDAHIRVAGELHLHSDSQLSFSAKDKITQVSGEYSLLARQSLVNIDALNVVGKTLTSRFERMQSFAQHAEQIVEHLLQRCKNVFRTVSQLDQSRSHNALHEVENLYSLRTNQAAIVGKSDIKIDAERIHMG